MHCGRAAEFYTLLPYDDPVFREALLKIAVSRRKHTIRRAAQILRTIPLGDAYRISGRPTPNCTERTDSLRARAAKKFPSSCTTKFIRKIVVNAA